MSLREESGLWQEWSPPDGVSLTVPRSVRFTRAGLGLLAVALLLFAGGMFAAVRIGEEGRQWDRRDDAMQRRMAEEGWNAEGLVTRRWREGLDALFENDHHVAYRFALGFRDYRGQAMVGEAFWKTLHVGSTISVRYLPADPRHNYPSASPPRRLPMWLPPVLLGGIIAAAGIFPLVLVGRERRLLAYGTLTPAEITTWQRTGERYYAAYRFPLPGGGSSRGSCETGRDQPVTGTVISILYDSRRPRRNSPYPLNLMTPR